MIRRLVLFSVAIAGICGMTLWVFKIFNRPTVTEILPVQVPLRQDEVFLSTSTNQPNFGSTPRLTIEIEGHPLEVELDLGFSGGLCVINTILEQLKDKSFIKTVNRYGLRGNKHPGKLYQIPELHMSHLVFSPIVLEEESEQMREECIIRGDDPRFTIHPAPGKVGWQLFETTVLFLDLGHSKIAIGDSIETLQQKGYSFESFTKAALLMDRDLVEVTALTSQGPLRCFLDTGCTFNLIHRENTKELPLNKVMLDEELSLKSPIFQIGEKDLGAIIFHPFPIQFLEPIEAILGMEFFSKHQVVLDFRNREIYISPRRGLQN